MRILFFPQLDLCCAASQAPKIGTPAVRRCRQDITVQIRCMENRYRYVIGRWSQCLDWSRSENAGSAQNLQELSPIISCDVVHKNQLYLLCILFTLCINSVLSASIVLGRVLARISHKPSAASANRTSYRTRDLRGDLHVFLHTVARHTAPRTRYDARFTLSLRSL